MQIEDKKKFYTAIMGTWQILRADKINEAVVNVYFETMKDYNVDDVVNAFSISLKTCKFFPRPAELIEIIEQSSGQKQISAKSKSEIQADIVLKKLRYEGRNGTVDFADPVTLHLMSSRWKYTTWASNVIEADLKWWRREFCDAYQAYAEQNQAQQQITGPGNEKLKHLAAGMFKELT